MKMAAIVLLGIATMASAADRDNCITRGKPGHARVYCDKSGPTYQYGNTIITPDGERWRQFGNHAYGPNGQWMSLKKNGNAVGSYKSNPGKKAVIIPDIYSRGSYPADHSDSPY